MHYLTVLEHVTLQSLKETFREWLLFRHIYYYFHILHLHFFIIFFLEDISYNINIILKATVKF